MEPSEFLTQEDFDALEEDAGLAYINTFMQALDGVDRMDSAGRVAYRTHFFDLAEWILLPEEFDQRIRMPVWDAVWKDAERSLSILEKALACGDVPESERPRVQGSIEKIKAVVEHKHSLASLDETPPC